VIRRTKGFEPMIFFFYNSFEHIWFKSAFDPKNDGFWKCGLNKVVHIYAWMHNIHNIKSIYSQNVSISKNAMLNGIFEIQNFKL
jgi:hypothetical protein